MKKHVEIIILIAFIIFSTTNFASARLENLSYSMKKGDTIEYVINSFHNQSNTIFPVNFPNKTVMFAQGTHFNITVVSVNSTYISLELNYNNLTTTNLTQSFLSYFNFAHKSSNSTNDYEIKKQNGFHYYISGDFYHQDFSSTYQSGTSYYNETTFKDSWDWKTGWEQSYYQKRDAFILTSKGEYWLFYDILFEISMVQPVNSSKPLPAFQLFSLFVLALIPIKRRLS